MTATNELTVVHWEKRADSRQKFRVENNLMTRTNNSNVETSVLVWYVTRHAMLIAESVV